MFPEGFLGDSNARQCWDISSKANEGKSRIACVCRAVLQQGAPGVFVLGFVLCWPCGKVQADDFIGLCTWKSLASKRFTLVFTGI